MIKNLITFFVSMIIGAICTWIFFVYIHKTISQKNQTKIRPTLTAATHEKDSFHVKGSIPYWDQQHAFASFKNNVSAFDYINLFWYFIDEKGHLQKYNDAYEDTSILQFAKDHGVKTTMVITNLPQDPGSTWDAKRVAYVLQHTAAQKTEINQIVQKAHSLGFTSVLIDYESVSVSQKDLFSSFIKDLAAELHKNDISLFVDLHPKTKDDVGIGGFQDWTALGKYADQLQIMGYDEHGNEDPAGPIASLPWVDKILSFAVSQDVPKKKLYLGIPAYGYSWQKNNGASAVDLTYDATTTLIKTQKITPKWNSDFASPHFTYMKDGNMFEVWFENQKSMEGKVKLAKEYGIGGVTFWRLGEEDPSIWSAIQKYK